MEVLTLAFLLVVGLVVLFIFGIMAFQSMQDFLEEKKQGK